MGTATRCLFYLREGEAVDFKESGPFGKSLKCRLLHHFTRSSSTEFGGVEEKHVDYYANLRVEVGFWGEKSDAFCTENDELSKVHGFYAKCDGLYAKNDGCHSPSHHGSRTTAMQTA